MSRNEVFQVRVSKEEKELLRADAAAFNDTIANWLRRCWKYARAELLRPEVAGSSGNGNGVVAGPPSGVSSGLTKAKSPRKGRKNGSKKTSRKRRN